jgi:phosphoglycolate phosphatase-like HAD superfamily hydrolase
MPLNISIDVDGTILDANENLLPHVRESLQLLKDAGHCLQLWSAGGADYAYKHALKNKLTDLFESYAKKSDVAIDDLPETAHPLAVIHVDRNHTLDQAVKKVLSIEENVDAALTLSSALVNFVQQLQAEENHIREQYGAILRPNIPLHPIPFFGVIENARVVTVGLNPSSTEFIEAGRWPTTLTPCELAQRLVRYFREPEITPHYWFAELQWSLEILHCPYHFAAAHVDASPWTTYGPRHLAQYNPTGLQCYNELLNDGIQNWLPKTLGFCKDTVKLIVNCSGNMQVEQKIRDTLGPEWNGEIVAMPNNKVARWAWENRNRLIRLLDLENTFT